MDATKFFEEVVSILDEGKNYACTLKKGELVYVKYNNTIMQAKVNGIKTDLNLSGFANSLIVITSLSLLLANGTYYNCL